MKDSPTIIQKYNMKDTGLKLEKQDPLKAIDYYNNLIHHEFFENDFWVYRRLVLMYKKTKQLDKKTEIIKEFFKSGIYANNYQYLWFKNKLKRLSDKDLITSDEILLLTDYFKKNSLPNCDKANTPLPIADRIRKSKDRIIVEKPDRYEEKQTQFEYEEKCSELNRQKRYYEYINLLNYMIDELGYNRYRYFQKLCIVYRKLDDRESELEVIERYFNSESTKTKVSDEWFLKRRESLKDDESEFEISPGEDNPIYEYSDDLTLAENIKRKAIMIEYGKTLTREKQYNDAILYYKYLSNNTYFTNDWYPYRQLTIIYEKTNDHAANLVNIKKLLYSKIYLNQYQFIWFCEKLRQLMEKTDISEYEVKKWLDYYEIHGNLREKKLNQYLADKFQFRDGKIMILDDEKFNHTQERCALEETGRIYERMGNYSLAVRHYSNIISTGDFNYYQFYQRLCLCLEKLNDYERIVKAVKLYYKLKPVNRNKCSDEWFNERLQMAENRI